MELRPSRLPGAYEIRLSPIEDPRGYFLCVYDVPSFRQHGLVTEWMQENQSLSRRMHTLRGLHFQVPPHSETKLVRCLQGSVWDVFVDLRTASPTYGQWDAITLAADSFNAAYIPKGFAHAFCTLTPDAIVSYRVDATYAPDSQAGLAWNDPALGIPWPTATPFVSERDARMPTLDALGEPFAGWAGS